LQFCPAAGFFLPPGINKSAPCFSHQSEDLVIPHIGPEFIAALRDKSTPERSNAVIGGSLIKHDSKDNPFPYRTLGQ
jgi:hypothetical protein